jgi:hypothetical protein
VPRSSAGRHHPRAIPPQSFAGVASVKFLFYFTRDTSAST